MKPITDSIVKLIKIYILCVSIINDFMTSLFWNSINFEVNKKMITNIIIV